VSLLLKRFKAFFLQIAANQFTANDPTETRETLKRLMAQGVTLEDAKIYIAQAVCVEPFSILKQHNNYNQKRYIRNLKHLPK
jgi:hypothetical protein